MSDIKIEFQAAVEQARQALAEFAKSLQSLRETLRPDSLSGVSVSVFLQPAHERAARRLSRSLFGLVKAEVQCRLAAAIARR